jgi:hypothetical protein
MRRNKIFSTCSMCISLDTLTRVEIRQEVLLLKACMCTRVRNVVAAVYKGGDHGISIRRQLKSTIL